MAETCTLHAPDGLAIQGAQVFGRFNDFTSDDELTDGTPFIYTTVNVGAGGATPTTVEADAKYGVTTHTCGGNEDDGGQIQDERACFQTNKAGEFTVYYSREELSEATQIDWATGLALNGDTSLLASNPTDGIYFITGDGDAYIYVVCRRNAAETRSGIAGVLDTGTHEYAYVVEPDADSSVNCTIFWYIDGKNVWTFRPSATLAQRESQCDDNPYDEALSRSNAVLAGAASAYTRKLDCIGAWHVSPNGRGPSL
jgi:hypothetical protein